MKKLISLCIIALLSTNILFAQATDDNEIKIEQEGDTLKLYIDKSVLVTKSVETMQVAGHCQIWQSLVVV